MVRAALLFSAAVIASAVTVPEVVTTYLKAEKPVAGEAFGRSAALSEDGTISFVGAATRFIGVPEYTPALPGSVTVYANNTLVKTWTGVQTDEFGSSIAVSGNTVVIGAIGETTVIPSIKRADGAILPGATPVTSNGVAIGGAFIYELDAATGGLVLKGLVKPPTDCASAMYCGASVSIEGNTIVMGCPLDGTAWAITRAAGAEWSTATVKELVPETVENNALFGFATAIVDGVIFVGDPQKKKVSKFVAASGSYTATTLTPPASMDADVAQYSAFGASLAVVGDLIAVGAPRTAGCEAPADRKIPVAADADRCPWTGAAFFYRTTAVGAVEPEFSAYGRVALSLVADAAGKAAFGISLAAKEAGDIETVYVAAPGDATCGVGANIAVPATDDCIIESGTVFVYEKNGTAKWALVNAFKSAGPVYAGVFGSAIAVRNETLLVGALGEGNVNGGVNPAGLGTMGAPASGAAYLFTPKAEEIVNATCAVAACGQEFGGACAASIIEDGAVATCGAGTFAADAATAAGVVCANSTNITLTCVGAVATDKAGLEKQVLAFTNTTLLVNWAKANNLTVAVSTKCATQCTAANTLANDVELKNSVARCFECLVEARQTIVGDYLGRVVAVCLPGVDDEECLRELVCQKVLEEGDDCAGTPCPSCSSSSKKGLLGLLGLLGLIPLLLCCCCLLWLCCIRRRKADPEVHFATFDPCAPGTVGCVAPSMAFPADHCVGGSILTGAFPHATATGTFACP